MQQTRIRSDYAIEQRRKSENKLTQLSGLLKQETNIQQQAVWENKTNLLIEKQQTKQKKELFIEQRKKFLDFRRQKLSDLLKSEEQRHRQEIILNQETPEQVRAKMEQKLKVLKEQREAERLETVRRLQEKKFFERNDELRKQDSEAFTLSCYLEQENQMLEKIVKREKEREKEEVYLQLLNYYRILEDIKERKKAEERIKLKKETLDQLNWQNEQIKLAAEREMDLKRLEIEKLKEQWDRDLETEKKEKESIIAANKQVYKDIEEFNRREEIIRHQRSTIEKIKDKELVNSILEKEKALDEIDKKEKDRKKSEFYQNKMYLEYIMNQKQEAELWMDKLCQEEADKQWNKMKEQWEKEENAKIDLLRQVYSEREKAVLYKLNVKDQEKVELVKERQELDQAIEDHNKKLELLRIEEEKRRKSHQSDLLYQIENKKQVQHKEKQDALYNERAAKMWELEYTKKLQEQKDQHKKRMEMIKKQGIQP